MQHRKQVYRALFIGGFLLLLLGPIAAALIIKPKKLADFFLSISQTKELTVSAPWIAPDVNTIPSGPIGDAIRYGRELIMNTAHYLGPNGEVMAISNGMNCQNCHLSAGTKIFGNNFSAVASTYPKFRARSGSIETVEKRINDCIERSLNGQSLPIESKEMKAMVAYLNWLGQQVKKGESPVGAGLLAVPFLNVAASPEQGKLIYDRKCVICHGTNGQGMPQVEGTGWVNPPLWGRESYNTGAGLYRLSRMAGYLKANMPFGSTADAPQLTDEEAWHVAAYVNSMERPVMDISKDWPDVATKPMDHPFGPFADGFSEEQHKYGPFKPIVNAQKKKLVQ